MAPYELSILFLLFFIIIIIIVIIIISVSTSFSGVAMTSSGDVTSAFFRQMRFVSTASLGVSLRTDFLSSDRRKNPPRTPWNASM